MFSVPPLKCYLLSIMATLLDAPTHIYEGGNFSETPSSKDKEQTIRVARDVFHNVLKLFVQYYDADDSYLLTLHYLNALFTGLFTMETFLKLHAFGPRVSRTVASQVQPSNFSSSTLPASTSSTSLHLEQPRTHLRDASPIFCMGGSTVQENMVACDLHHRSDETLPLTPQLSA